MALYTLPEIIKEAQENFELKDFEQTPANLRKKIEKILRNITVSKNGKSVSLWEKACSGPSKDKSGKKSGQGKKGENKPRYFFTEYERQLIFDSPDFRRYIAIQIDDKEVAKDVDEAAQEAKRLNREERAYKDETPEVYYQRTMKELIEDEDTSYIIEGKLRQKKLELMVEALYLKFFEPLDEMKLRDDMEAVEAISYEYGRRHTSISRLATEHLKNPLYYCKEKKEPSDK